MAQFCPSCGHHQENPNNAFCSKCGAPLNNAQQQFQQPMNAGMNMAPQESHTAAIVVGYIFATIGTWFLNIFGLIITIVFGVYLYTRDNEEVHKHGLIMIAVSVVITVVVWIIAFALISSSSYYY